MAEIPPRPSLEILLAALDCMGEGLFIVGTDGKILYFSVRAEELTGIRASEIVGKECSVALRGGLCGIDQAMLRGVSLDHEEFELIIPEGGRLRVHRSLRPLVGADGARLGTVVTFHLPGGAAPTACEAGNAVTGSQEALHQFVGRSLAVRKVVDTVRRVAASDATVLITGESGTGKELVARAIHENSRRRSRPMIAVNCAAIPHDLLESELFGHVRGAFTGAVRDRKGSVELAAGGTLFLDEIGDLAMPMQAKLLRVLQERTYQRVGESRAQPTDVRILAATNASLEEAIAAGVFRHDLYFRLAVIPIRIPPLRDRREDIAPLATFLLSRRSVAAGRLPMRVFPGGHALAGDCALGGQCAPAHQRGRLCGGAVRVRHGGRPQPARRVRERPAGKPAHAASLPGRRTRWGRRSPDPQHAGSPGVSPSAHRCGPGHGPGDPVPKDARLPHPAPRGRRPRRNRLMLHRPLQPPLQRSATVLAPPSSLGSKSGNADHLHVDPS